MGKHPPAYKFTPLESTPNLEPATEWTPICLARLPHSTRFDPLVLRDCPGPAEREFGFASCFKALVPREICGCVAALISPQMIAPLRVTSCRLPRSHAACRDSAAVMQSQPGVSIRGYPALSSVPASNANLLTPISVPSCVDPSPLRCSCAVPRLLVFCLPPFPPSSP